MYLDKGIGPTGRNLIKLAELQTFLLKTSRHFVILADWNFEPHQLAELDWLSSIQGEIIMLSELQITCSSGSGRMLDFAVISKGFVPIVRGFRGDLTTPWKPHTSICLDIAAKPRSVMARFRNHVLPLHQVVDQDKSSIIPWQPRTPRRQQRFLQDQPCR